MRSITDLSGRTFGRLRVLGMSERSATGIIKWDCVCKCGKKVSVQGGALKNGHTKSCGCYMREVTKCLGESSKKIWHPIEDKDRTYIIPLSSGFFSKVDKDDYFKIKDYSWYLMNTGYAGAHYNEKVVLMHRIIMVASSNTYVDHISMDKLDNRKSNLRIVEFSDNIHNTRLRSTNSSGFKGVTFDRQTNMWRSSCIRNGNKFDLGKHSTPEEAALSYDSVVRDIDGIYARLNFPKKGELSCR